MSRRIIVPKGLIQNDVTVVIEIPEELADESDLIASPASSLTDNTENIKIQCKSPIKSNSQKSRNQSTNVDREAIRIKEKLNYVQNSNDKKSEMTSSSNQSNQSPEQRRHSRSNSDQKHKHKNEIFPSRYMSTDCPQRFQSAPRDRNIKLGNPINLIAAYDIVENRNYETRCNDRINWYNEPPRQTFYAQSTQHPSQWNQNQDQLFSQIDQSLGRCRTPPPCKPQQWVPINHNRDTSEPSFPVNRHPRQQYLIINQENLRVHNPNEFSISPQPNQYIDTPPLISSSKPSNHALKVSNNNPDSNRLIRSTSISSSCQTPVSNSQRLMNIMISPKVVHERQSSNLNEWMLNQSGQEEFMDSSSLSNSTQQRQKHSNCSKFNSLSCPSSINSMATSSSSNRKRCDSRSFSFDRRNRNFQPPLSAVIEDEQDAFSTNFCGDFEKNIDNKPFQGQQLFKKDKCLQCGLNGENNLTRIVVPQLDLDCNEFNGGYNNLSYSRLNPQYRLGYAYLETAYEEDSSKIGSDFSDNYESCCTENVSTCGAVILN